MRSFYPSRTAQIGTVVHSDLTVRHLGADRTRGALCKAFGLPALIRQPGRMRFRWENANTLLLEFDAGSLEVVTTNLQAGYLRPNGVPYSDRAVVREFFDSFSLGDDGTWLIVTTVVSDPTYLTQEFVLSSQFKKETDLSDGNPARVRFRRPRCRRRPEGGSDETSDKTCSDSPPAFPVANPHVCV